MKDLREKQLRILLEGIEFSIVLQSIVIEPARIRTAWLDLWNYYEMIELV